MTMRTKRALQCASLCVLLGCGSDDAKPADSEQAEDQETPKADSSEPSKSAVETEASKTADEGKADDAKAAHAEPADAKAEDGKADPAKPDAKPAEETVVKYPDPRGACDLHTDFDDDHACIPAPKAGEGMQIHVGPTDYKNKAETAKFVLHPGEEVSACWTLRTPNDEDIYYQTSELSGRAGTHHIINQMFSGDIEEGGFARCADSGNADDDQAPKVIRSIPGASKPYMPRGHVAPENKHIGNTIPAHALVQADMHYYNFTDHDILREFWMNVYYVDKAEVQEESLQIRGMGGFGWNQEPIPPGTDNVYSYECPITGEGRIIQLLGHYHAHGKRLTAFLKRGDADKQKVFEMYDYQDPAIFDYDSLTTNPQFSSSAPGAVSGMLDVHDGDVLSWECHVVNDSNVGLKYVNEVKTGEMCNLWGASLGIDKFDCLQR
jgi:hypothetical protein